MYDRAVVEKLAKYVAQANGDMETAVRERQRGNPQFAFLFGGEGADFYRECLQKFGAEARLAARQGALVPSTDSRAPPVPPPRQQSRGVEPGSFCGSRGAGGGPGFGGAAAPFAHHQQHGGPGRGPVYGAPPPNGPGPGYPAAAAGTLVMHSRAPRSPPAAQHYGAVAPQVHAGDDASNPDLPRILELLEQRDDLRARREWAEADVLKEELFALNVRMDDRNKTWCIKPYSALPSSDAGAAAGPVGVGAGIGGAPPPKRHDYTRSASDSVRLSRADEAAIHELISKRLAAKMAHEFELADALRGDLRGMGVDIVDREKTWFIARANDVPSARHGPRPPPGPPPRAARGSGSTRVASGGPSLMPGVAPSEQHDYLCGSDSVELRRVDMGAVHAVLAQRLAAKKRGQFDLSDQLRGTLHALGVEVFDREKIWRVLPHTPAAPPPDRSRDEGRGGDTSRHGYDRDPTDSAWVDLAAVDALLVERMSSKFNRNFERADALREVLRREHGVEVQDSSKTWRVGGGGYVGRPVGPSARYDGDMHEQGRGRGRARGERGSRGNGKGPHQSKRSRSSSSHSSDSKERRHKRSGERKRH